MNDCRPSEVPSKDALCYHCGEPAVHKVDGHVYCDHCFRCHRDPRPNEAPCDAVLHYLGARYVCTKTAGHFENGTTLDDEAHGWTERPDPRVDKALSVSAGPSRDLVVDPKESGRDSLKVGVGVQSNILGAAGLGSAESGLHGAQESKGQRSSSVAHTVICADEGSVVQASENSSALDPERCSACRTFVERNAPPKPRVVVKNELWDAAILKVRQLESEIRASGASDREKSNMLHTHSKLWMFATDAWEQEVTRPAQRRAADSDYPTLSEDERDLLEEVFDYYTDSDFVPTEKGNAAQALMAKITREVKP